MPLQEFLTKVTTSLNISKTTFFILVGGIPLAIIIILVLIYGTSELQSELTEEQKPLFILGATMIPISIVILVFAACHIREKCSKPTYSTQYDMES